MAKKKKSLMSTNSGQLVIGNITLQCANLDDGTRVLSGRSVTLSMGLKGRGQGMQRFLDSKSLNPFISKSLSVAIRNPIEYETKNGFKRYGYPAEILPDICSSIIEAKEKNGLTRQQYHMAKQARILMRSFAKLGIIALVDEATGYQYNRDQKELQIILKGYISSELLPWSMRFPPEFYNQMFRIFKWNWKSNDSSSNRPIYAGKFTKDYVYSQLPDGVLEELESKNPVINNKRRKTHHHRFLTEEIGNPHLEKQITKIITLMQISSDKEEFLKHFKNASPKKKK